MILESQVNYRHGEEMFQIEKDFNILNPDETANLCCCLSKRIISESDFVANILIELNDRLRAKPLDKSHEEIYIKIYGILFDFLVKTNLPTFRRLEDHSPFWYEMPEYRLPKK